MAKKTQPIPQPILEKAKGKCGVNISIAVSDIKEEAKTAPV